MVSVVGNPKCGPARHLVCPATIPGSQAATGPEYAVSEPDFLALGIKNARLPALNYKALPDTLQIGRCGWDHFPPINAN